MTPTERQRIEKEAKEFANPWTPPNSNRRVAVDSYIAGAIAEHDKARNQAIDDVLGIFENKDVVSIRFLIKEIKLLRTKQETSD